MASSRDMSASAYAKSVVTERRLPDTSVALLTKVAAYLKENPKADHGQIRQFLKEVASAGKGIDPQSNG